MVFIICIKLVILLYLSLLSSLKLKSKMAFRLLRCVKQTKLLKTMKSKVLALKDPRYWFDFASLQIDSKVGMATFKSLIIIDGSFSCRGAIWIWFFSIFLGLRTRILRLSPFSIPFRILFVILLFLVQRNFLASL